ncbi:MAG: peptidoglycan-binding protein [Actinomyces urogenitalis]|uniref:peptidoglycan-binding domain-containing protein n=1 Tax=Actinomyces urogenitalis TaxID=103621 RepID=UPI00242A9063|nr:peptidoglycan-binding domain-containing protein [Actinomyces urogenitalis]MBS5976744.1 peptidoglycan-binding protein [Actinomyces urogenitalis]
MTFPGPSDPMDTQEADAPRPQRRRRLVLLAVVVTVAVVAGTWWLARSVQSPAQRDAAAAPPTVQPVTVAVASGDLHDEITAAATVVQTETQTVTLPLADGRSVVSRQLVAPGQQLRAGQVLLHVSGRPLIALPGAFPTYRDLVQGDQGDDVVQLQQALASLGYNVRADGDFGAATASALRNLYTDLGYSVPTTTRQAGGTEGDGADATQRGMSSSGPGAQERKDAQAGTATQTTLLTLPQAEVVYVPSLASCPVVTELPAQGRSLTLPPPS